MANSFAPPAVAKPYKINVTSGSWKPRFTAKRRLMWRQILIYTFQLKGPPNYAVLPRFTSIYPTSAMHVLSFW